MAKLPPGVVIIGDVHAAESAWANRPIRGDAKFSMQQIAAYCIDKDNNIDSAIVLGDAYDKVVAPSYANLLWDEFLASLHAARVRVYFVQGNHDWSEPPWLSRHHAIHLNGSSIQLLDLSFYSFDFREEGELQKTLADIPTHTDVVCCHQGWQEANRGDPQGSLKDVPHACLVLSGDLHETVELDLVGASAQPMRFVSPGSVCMQSIDEPADKYFFVLRQGGVPERVKLRTRPVYPVVCLNTDGELAEFLATARKKLVKFRDDADAAGDLPGHITAPLVKVNYSYKLTNCAVRITKAIGDLCHLFWDTVPPEAEERRKVAVSVTGGVAASPVALLPQALAADEFPDAFALASSLLRDEQQQAKTIVDRFCSQYLEQHEEV